MKWPLKNFLYSTKQVYLNQSSSTIVLNSFTRISAIKKMCMFVYYIGWLVECVEPVHHMPRAPNFCIHNIDPQDRNSDQPTNSTFTFVYDVAIRKSRR